MAEQLSISSPRLLSKIEASLQSFSPNDHRIADYLLVAYPQTTWGTVEEVAQATGVSKSAVVRLATRLGYDGFQELQRELQADFAELLASPALLVKQRAQTDTHVVTTSLERALDNLQRTYDRLASSKLFDEVAARLASCDGQILVLGMRKSFGLAAYLHYLLSSARSNVRLARPDTASFPESLVDLGAKDIVVAISVRRYTRTTLQAMEYARGAGVYVVAISDTVAGPAAARADVVLAAASEGVLLFDSAISIVFILEALANSMVGLAYDDALARLELTESIGGRFALFESATTPATAATQVKRPRAKRRRPAT